MYKFSNLHCTFVELFLHIFIKYKKENAVNYVNSYIVIYCSFSCNVKNHNTGHIQR